MSHAGHATVSRSSLLGNDLHPFGDELMIHIAKLPRRVLACGGIALAASLALAGCANPVEKLMESATSSATDSLMSDLTGVDVETAEIPADFPAEIPLPDAKPTVAMSQTQDGTRNWILHFEEGISDQVFDDLNAALAANGFEADTNSDMPGAMRIATHTGSDHTVNLSLLGSADKTQILQMMVFETAK